MYWKVNVDMSVINGLERTGPNSDAVSGFVVPADPGAPRRGQAAARRGSAEMGEGGSGP